MTQRDRLRQMDAKIAARFRAAGMADSVRYTSATRGAAAVSGCTAFVDRDWTADGFQSQLGRDQVVVTLFLAEIGERPQRGARIEVLDTEGAVTDVYTVDGTTPLQGSDESKVVLACKVGT